MARVGAEAHEEALRKAHVRRMDLTGEPLKGFVTQKTRAWPKSA